MNRREMQDAMDKLILETLNKGEIHWSDLCRKVLGAHQPCATLSRFRSRMGYLLKKGHMERVAKGVYQITESGKRYLESL
jgi:predicted transcriptional regulator